MGGDVQFVYNVCIVTRLECFLIKMAADMEAFVIDFVKLFAVFIYSV